MRKPVAAVMLLAGIASTYEPGAGAAPFICETFTATEGAIVRTLQEKHPGIFGNVVTFVRISYIGVNEAGTPEFREARTIFRPVTTETFWKGDNIDHRNRYYEIDILEARVLDRTMAARPLSLRVLGVMSNGDLQYRLEPPDGCAQS